MSEEETKEPGVGTPEWVKIYIRPKPGAIQTEINIAKRNLERWQRGDFGPDAPPTRPSSPAKPQTRVR